MAQALDAAVRDERGVQLRYPDDQPPWQVYYPARDAHMFWTWLLVPATKTKPARVHPTHTGTFLTPTEMGDVAAVIGVLRRWLEAEPVPDTQGTLL